MRASERMRRSSSVSSEHGPRLIRMPIEHGHARPSDGDSNLPMLAFQMAALLG